MLYRTPLCLLLALAAFCATAQAPVRTGRDYAVFFYVTQFQPGWQPLPETEGDARALKDELETRYGFSCRLVPNPTRQQIRDSLAAWNRRLTSEDQILYFFSMHGHYDPAGDLGYLVAADGRYHDSYAESYLCYNDLRAYFARCSARHVLVAIDACYSGSFGTRERARPDAPDYGRTPDCAGLLSTAMRYRGRQYVCSGNKNARVPARSAFAAKFLEALRRGGSVEGLLFFDDLTYMLGKVQNPQPEHGTFADHEAGGHFVFVPRNACAPKPLPDRDGDGVPDFRDVEDIAGDLAAWKKARASDTEAAYREYLRRFPQGEFKEAANEVLRRVGVPEVVFIRGGIFQMGSNEGDSNEQPVHSVTVGDFYLGKYEVTVGEFKRFIDDTGYQTDADKHGGSYFWTGSGWELKAGVNWRCDAEGKLRPEREYNHPVVHVSWNDAVAYCDWLSRKTGRRYRLPTEAEWEYAAGNGRRHTKYSWGDGAPSGRKGGNVADETAKKRFSGWTNIFSGYSDGYVFTAPVGSFAPNDFGLYDMSGNVWEWCSDWYAGGYYKSSPSVNPAGPSSGSFRVVRGGSWYSIPAYCRVARRGRRTPGSRLDNLGFRVVLVPQSVCSPFRPYL